MFYRTFLSSLLMPTRWHSPSLHAYKIHHGTGAVGPRTVRTKPGHHKSCESRRPDHTLQVSHVATRCSTRVSICNAPIQRSCARDQPSCLPWLPSRPSPTFWRLTVALPEAMRASSHTHAHHMPPISPPPCYHCPRAAGSRLGGSRLGARHGACWASHAPACAHPHRALMPLASMPSPASSMPSLASMLPSPRARARRERFFALARARSRARPRA